MKTPITLTSAELVMLVSATGARADAFIGDTDLVGLSDAVLEERLWAGRRSAVARGLSHSGPNGMVLHASAGPALRAVAQPQSGLQLMHARAGAAPVRSWIGRGNDGAWGVLSAQSASVFVLRNTADADAAAAIVADQCGVALMPESALNTVVTLPAKLIQSILESDTDALKALPKALARAGMPEGEAALLSAAGLRPTAQSALTTLNANGGTLSARAVLWFGNADSTWISETIADDGSVTLRRATRGMVDLAIRALVDTLSQG
jgi:hypothetical protein